MYLKIRLSFSCNISILLAYRVSKARCFLVLFMPITLGLNIASLRGLSQLKKSGDGVSKAYERLSSGQRINHASDDAVGMAMATGLEADSRIYGQAIRNVNDGASALNVADSALGELHNILTRIKELSSQAANGTLTFQQRSTLNDEANALADEYNRIIDTTQFNNIDLFNRSDNSMSIQAGQGEDAIIKFSVGDKLTRTAGDGTFQTFTSNATGTLPDAVVEADINNDGNADLIVGNFTSANLSILLGNGDGTFQAQSLLAAGSQPASIDVADLNGDGNLDLVVGNRGTGAGTFSFFSGNGDGTFSPKVDYVSGLGPGAENVEGVAIGDIDGDGVNEVITANRQEGTVEVFENDGSGNFTSSTTYAVGANARDVKLADLNNDGILDLISNGSSNQKVLLGNGDGTFGTATSYSTSSIGSSGAETADLNNDGYLDLVVNGRTNSEFGILLNNGDGTFQSMVTTTTSGTDIANVLSADLNGDGNADVVVSDLTSGGAFLYLGNGDGTFQAEQTLDSTTTRREMVAYDFNGDGGVDLAMTGAGTNTLDIFMANTEDKKHLPTLRLFTQSEAQDTMDFIDGMMNRVHAEAAGVGSTLGRLDIALSNLVASKDIFTAAAHNITDVDVAEELANLVKNSILQQANVSILAQANQSPELVLKLLS